MSLKLQLAFSSIATAMLHKGLATVTKRSGVFARAASIDARAVTFDRFGSPEAVLRVQNLKLDDDLKAGQVLVKVLAAPITVTDLGKVKGFNSAAKLPHVAGNEGIAVVEKVGPGVTGLKANDVVVPAIPDFGTWCTHSIAAESDVVKVADAAPASVERAAASIVSPGTALRLLSDFAELREGDVIIQNNAGSTVAQCVVQLAAKRGIKTVNILRQRHDWDEYVNHLKGIGATLVVDSDFAKTPAFAALISDLPAPKLGLNSCGGESALTVAKSLASGATMVTFGASSGKPVQLPLDLFVTKDITLKGFSMQKYLADASGEQKSEFIRSAFALTTDKDFSQLLATEPFADFESALKRAQAAGERKVVLKM